MYKNERSNSFFMGIVTVLFYIFYVECLRENNNTRIYILAFSAFAGLVLVRALFGGKMLEYSKFFGFCILFYAFSYMHTWIGYTWYPYSSYDMLDQILMQYASFYVIFLFFKNFDNTDKIVNLFITSCVIMTLISLGSSISTLGSERLGGWFNSNTVAVFSGFIATFAYTMFLRDKKVRYLIIVAYLVVIVLLTGSRKGLLTVGVGIIAINILLTKNYKLLKILAFIPLLIVAYHIIMNWEPLYDLLGYRVEELLTYLQGGKIRESSLESRTSMIEDAMILIKKRPWLGYGLNSFRYMDARELYSHNNYVELLFSGGIPMLAVYYLMHLWMLIKSLKLMFIKNKPAMDVAVFCVLVMMLVNDIGMVSYYSKYFITLQMFMFVYIEARTKAEKAKKLALKEESEGAHEKEDMLLHT